METVTVGDLHAAKRDGRKLVGIVAWDAQMAAISDRAGVDIISVGDSVGVNLWGRSSPLQITMDEILVVAKAVRRGTKHALLSCDLPFGPLQEGPIAAVRAAVRLVTEAGVDMVKLDAAAFYPDSVAAIERAGVPVFAQIGITPQTALRHGIKYDSMAAASAIVPDALATELLSHAKQVEEAGAALIDFTNSGAHVGPIVTEAAGIPVLGGFGGGPWLDGRLRMATAAIGYAAAGLDDPPTTYANVAKVAYEAISALVEDVRAGRQIRT